MIRFNRYIYFILISIIIMIFMMACNSGQQGTYPISSGTTITGTTTSGTGTTITGTTTSGTGTTITGTTTSGTGTTTTGTTTSGTGTTTSLAGACDEVVTNGCFDTDVSNWTNVTMTIASDASGASAKCLILTGTSSSNSQGFKSSTNVKSAGSNTEISFYLKGSTSSRSISVRLGGTKYFNIGGTIIDDSTSVSPGASASYTDPIDTGGQWRKITLTGIDTVTSLTSNPIEIRFGSGGSTTGLYFDEFRFGSGAGSTTTTSTTTTVCSGCTTTTITTTTTVTTTVTTTTIPTSDTWTIGIYLDADNNLEGDGVNDVKEMMAANLDGYNINLVVLIDRISGESTTSLGTEGNFTNTRLLRVGNNSLTRLYSTELGISSGNFTSVELQMDDGQNVRKFANYLKNTYPSSTYYGMVFWNHGGGWRDKTRALGGTGISKTNKAVCWDDTSGSSYDKCLYMNEIQQALVQSSGDTGFQANFVGFDACLMGMLEVAYEMKSVAATSNGVMLASEELEPGAGWPYTTLLNDFKVKNPRTPTELGRSGVSAYSTYYVSEADTTLSAVDLTKIDALVTALNTFVTGMVSTGATAVKTARNSTQEYDGGGDCDATYSGDYIDLYDLANRLGSTTGSAGLKTAITDAVIAEWHHTGSSGDNTNSHGIAIYYPKSSTSCELSEYVFATCGLELLNNTTWENSIVKTGSTFIP